VTGVRKLILGATLLLACGVALPVVQEFKGHTVNSVRVAGEFQHVSRATLEQVVAGEITKGFFEVDVEAVRSAARALPWVREASVRRVWPDSLHVAIVERVPVARWNEDALMEADGDLFHPDNAVTAEPLPGFFGPPESEHEVLSAYARFHAALGSLGGGIATLRLLERGGWRVGLAGGVTLVLAEGQDAPTLKRFSRAASKEFGPLLIGVRQADLRYAGGFAVRLDQMNSED
jgi:cell division protein FtsQ